MASAPLIRNGITYVTAKAAAPGAGISADYITKLCRKGEVNAVLVGTTWYVDEASLAQFVARKEAAKKAQAEFNAQQLKEVASRAQAAKPEQPPARHHRSVRTNPAYAFSVATVVLLLAMSAGTFALSAPTQQSQLLAAAAGALPGPMRTSIDRVATTVFNFFCPFFSVCDDESVLTSAPATTTTRTLASQHPANSATTSRILNEMRPAPQPQPTVIERIVEKTETIVQTASGGITEQLLNSRLAALETYLAGRIDLLAYQGDRQAESLADSFADGIGGAGFDDIDITGSTFAGGSISGASISGGSLSGVTFSGETDFSSLTVDAATSTNATSTNLYISGSFGFGTDTGLLRNDSGTVSTLGSGSNGQILKIVGGTLAWSTDLTGGGGGGASFFASTTDNLAIYLADPSHVVILGDSATSTTGNILEVSGNSLFRGTATSYGLLTAPRFTATSSAASVFPYASTTALSATTLCLSSDCRNAWPNDTSFSTTSADYWKSVSNFFSTTSADYWETQQAPRGSSFAYPFPNNATSTALTFSGGITTAHATATSLFASSLVSPSATVGFITATSSSATSTFAGGISVLGPAQFANFSNFFGETRFGATGTTTIATDGTISTPSVSAQSATAQSATLTFASTTAISSNYASSTEGFFGSLSIGNFTGVLRATAGAISAALIDLASDVTGILPVANGGTGWANIANAAIPYGNGSGALATTTAGTNGQVLALLGGVPTWTASSTLSTISGTLDVSKGGTGAASFGYGLVLSPGGSSALTNIATSSLGLLTTHVAEGSNLYYTDGRVQTYLGTLEKGFFFSTTSADYWQTQRNFFSTTSADAWKLTRDFFSTTSTAYFVSVNQGSLFSTTSAIHFVHSSTTIPKTYTANAFTALQSFNAGLALPSLTNSLLATDGSGNVIATSTLASSLLSLPSGYTFRGNTSNLAEATSTLFVASSGNVGVGTTSPSQRLDVNGIIQTNNYFRSVRAETIGQPAFVDLNNSSGQSLTLKYAEEAISAIPADVWQFRIGGATRDILFSLFDSTPLLMIKGNGNVGIGTTSPSARFEIGDNSIGGIQAFITNSNSATNSYAELTVRNDYNTFNNVGGLRLVTLGTGYASSGIFAQDTAVIETGTGLSGGLNIGTAASAPLGFFTGGTSASNIRMTIDSSGLVGIGTTTPNGKLTINTGSGGTNLSLERTSGQVNRYSFDITSTGTGVGGALNLKADYADGAIGLRAAASGDDQLVLLSSGNLGIGTTSPSQALEVVGTARVTNSTQFGGLHVHNGTNLIADIKGFAAGNDNGVLQLYNGGTISARVMASGSSYFNGGNIGIGTTTPDTALTIHNASVPNANGQNVLKLQGAITAGTIGSGPRIVFTSTGASSGLEVADIRAYTFGASNTGLTFGTGGGGTITTRMAIDGSGNVGIGTTGPAQKFHIEDAGTVNALIKSVGGAAQLSLNGSAWGQIMNLGNTALLIDNATNNDIIFRPGSYTESMRLKAGGNVGIGTTSPWKTLSVVGTMSVNGLTLNTGAASASLCLSSSNEVTRNTDNESCITSSARYKHDIQSLVGTTTLSTLLALRPVSFEYNETPGIRYGLIAEEVDAIDPTLVGYDDEGKPNSVRYTSVIPLLIQAVQEITNITGQSKQNLIAWLADAQNGITDLFAKHLHAENITADTGTFGTVSADRFEGQEVCAKASGGSLVCLTADQFAAMLSQFAGAAAATSGASSPSNIPTPPAQNPEQEDGQTDDATASETNNTTTQNPSPDSAPDLTDSAQSPAANWTPEEPANDNNPSPDASGDSPPPVSNAPGSTPSSTAGTASSPTVANDNAPSPTESAI